MAVSSLLKVLNLERTNRSLYPIDINGYAAHKCKSANNKVDNSTDLRMATGLNSSGRSHPISFGVCI